MVALPPARPPRRFRFPLARAAAAITLVSWLVQGLHRGHPAPSVGAPASEVPPTWATDINQDATPAPEGGRVVTGKLLTGQKRVKGGTCNQEDQVPIGQGCWLALEKRPKPPPVRCGDFYEHAGRCFVPVLEAPRTPNSIVQ